jgi:hypothetical protein
MQNAGCLYNLIIKSISIVKITFISLIFLGCIWSNTSNAKIITSAYYEAIGDSFSGTPCITGTQTDGTSTSSSCTTKNYYLDTDGSYSIVSNVATSAIDDVTTLKSQSSISFDGQHDLDSILAEITANEAPSDEGEYLTMLQSNPEYFTGEFSEFDPSAFLNANVEDMPDYVSSYTHATLYDEWNISGGEIGTTGTVSIFYQLDGSVDNAILEYDGFSREGVANGQANLFFRDLSTSGDSFTILDEGYFDDVVELSFDFVFGQDFDVLFSLDTYTYAHFDYLNIPDFEISADFFNTAIFSDIEVKDANGELIDDYGLQSDLGVTAFEREQSTTVDVPEPSAFALLAFGVIMLLRSRR